MLKNTGNVSSGWEMKKYPKWLLGIKKDLDLKKCTMKLCSINNILKVKKIKKISRKNLNYAKQLYKKLH